MNGDIKSSPKPPADRLWSAARKPGGAISQVVEPSWSRLQQVDLPMNHGVHQRHDLYSETALHMGNEHKMWRQDLPKLQKHVGGQEMAAGARSRLDLADTRGDLALDEDFHRDEHKAMTATQRESELLRCHVAGTPRVKRSLDGETTRRVTQEEIDERHQSQPKISSRIFLPDPPPVDQQMDVTRRSQ